MLLFLQRLERSLQLRLRRRLGVDLVHEACDPLSGAQRRALAVLQLADQVRVARRLSTERRARHAVADEEGCDPVQQLGFRDDLHGRFINQRLLTLQALLSAKASLPVDNRMCEIADMPEEGENPLHSALLAVKPETLSLNAWAVRAGVNRNVWNDVRRRGRLRNDILEKLLDAAGASWAQFDALLSRPDERGNHLVITEVKSAGMTVHDVQRAWHGPQPSKPVPLLGTAFGGEWSDGVEMTELHLTDVLDYVGRPQAVAGDPRAYAVEIVGDSMEPRYQPGERAIVSPRVAARPGDDVIVQLRTNGEPAGDGQGGQLADPDHLNRVTMVLIKRLVRRSASFVELEQFNPPTRFQVPSERIAAIHRVMVRL